MHHMEFFHTLLWLLQKYLPCDIFHEEANKSAGSRQPGNTATAVEKQLMIIFFPHHYGCHFLSIIIIFVVVVVLDWGTYMIFFFKLEVSLLLIPKSLYYFMNFKTSLIVKLESVCTY